MVIGACGHADMGVCGVFRGYRALIPYDDLLRTVLLPANVAASTATPSAPHEVAYNFAMALPSPLKFSEPGSSTGGRLFSSQAGAPRLRPSRASMLTRAISPVTRAISPVTFNNSRTRLAGHGTSSFSDEFYHAPRRNSRWALLSAPVVVYKVTVSRFGRRQGPVLLCLCCLALFLTSYVFHRRYLSSDKAWPSPFRRPNTVVFEKEELRKIWEWEVWSGHYPSTRPSECLHVLYDCVTALAEHVATSCSPSRDRARVCPDQPRHPPKLT